VILVSKVIQVRALERMAIQALRVTRGLALKATLVMKVHLAVKAILVYRAILALAGKAIQEHRETRATLALALKVIQAQVAKAIRVLAGKVTQEFKVIRESRELRRAKVIQVLLEIKAIQERAYKAILAQAGRAIRG
jgi:uncharacterized protein (UPF0147 family)